jgi:drug/metabolite transporter (DMT)-like permease
MSHYIAAALVILCMGGGQVFLKIGTRDKKNWLYTFFDKFTLLGLGIYLLATVSNLYALQGIYLKHMTSWLGISYILVVVLSKYILKEHVNWAKIFGCFIIAVGIFVYSFPF